jgi:hypothetical protein
VVFDGQSLNQVPAGHSYPETTMGTYQPAVPWFNVAVGGASWTQLTATRAQRFARIPGYGYGIWVGCGGTTDLAVELDNGATLYANYWAYSDAARAAGFSYIIATTITPSTTFDATMETNRVAANALILADASNKFDAVCDFAADPRLDDPSDTTYYTGGLHFTAAGADVAAELMAPVLAAALPSTTFSGTPTGTPATLLTETGDPLLTETGLPLLTETALWAPGDPWPGTPGGASRDGWSPYVRLYLVADIGAGQPFTVGPDPAAKLNRGNVVAYPGQTVDSTLTVDLTADLTALHVQAGANTAAGVLSSSDAAVLDAELWDPDGKYDPLNPYSPYGLNSAQRLTGGNPVRCTAEIVNPDTAGITSIPMFTGTADLWAASWAKEPYDRRTNLQATDATKLFNKQQLPPETSFVGLFDSIRGRVERVAATFGWTGDILGPAVWTDGHLSALGMQDTDMGGTGWDQLHEAIELEVGFVHFSRAGALRWLDRTAWTHKSFPRILLGDMSDDPDAHDIVTDAVPLAFNKNLYNSIDAAPKPASGPPLFDHVESTQSVAAWGEQHLTRGDLPVVSSDDSLAWAQYVLALHAYPQTTLESVTVQPSVSSAPWTAYIGVLGAGLVTSIIRTLWKPPNQPVVPIDSRMVGWSMDVDPWEWSLELKLVSANMSTNAPVFTVGPAVRDALNAGNIIGF